MEHAALFRYLAARAASLESGRFPAIDSLEHGWPLPSEADVPFDGLNQRTADVAELPRNTLKLPVPGIETQSRHLFQNECSVVGNRAVLTSCT